MTTDETKPLAIVWVNKQLELFNLSREVTNRSTRRKKFHTKNKRWNI